MTTAERPRPSDQGLCELLGGGAELGVGEELADEAPQLGIGQGVQRGDGGRLAALARDRGRAFGAQLFHLFHVALGGEEVGSLPREDRIGLDGEGGSQLASGATECLPERLDVLGRHGPRAYAGRRTKSNRARNSWARRVDAPPCDYT
jgi:hypothetical protein